MRLKGSSSPWAGALAAIALALAGTAAMPAAPASAQAPLAGEKATVDAAKARGEVGEQSDGYLGLVHGRAAAGVAAAVDRINAGRKEAYASAAASTGVAVEAAAAAAARQLIARVPEGQFYRDAEGRWVRK